IFGERAEGRQRRARAQTPRADLGSEPLNDLFVERAVRGGRDWWDDQTAAHSYCIYCIYSAAASPKSALHHPAKSVFFAPSAFQTGLDRVPSFPVGSPKAYGSEPFLMAECCPVGHGQPGANGIPERLQPG